MLWIKLNSSWYFTHLWRGSRLSTTVFTKRDGQLIVDTPLQWLAILWLHIPTNWLGVPVVSNGVSSSVGQNMWQFMTEYVTVYDRICDSVWRCMWQFMTEYVTVYDSVCDSLWQNMWQFMTEYVTVYDRICDSVWQNMRQCVTEYVTVCDSVWQNMWQRVTVSCVPSWKVFSNLSPLVTQLRVQHTEQPIFFFCPRWASPRVKVIVPPSIQSVFRIISLWVYRVTMSIQNNYEYTE